MTLVARALRGFARFWWDFLIGDTPELFAAALCALGLTALVSESGHAHRWGAVVLVATVVVALAASLARAHRSRRD
ncbi:MAG: hypothetical protein ACRDV0_08995 [Acidimicrobiales bacterium]